MRFFVIQSEKFLNNSIQLAKKTKISGRIRFKLYKNEFKKNYWNILRRYQFLPLEALLLGA